MNIPTKRILLYHPSHSMEELKSSCKAMKTMLESLNQQVYLVYYTNSVSEILSGEDFDYDIFIRFDSTDPDANILNPEYPYGTICVNKSIESSYRLAKIIQDFSYGKFKLKDINTVNTTKDNKTLLQIAYNNQECKFTDADYVVSLVKFITSLEEERLAKLSNMIYYLKKNGTVILKGKDKNALIAMAEADPGYNYTITDRYGNTVYKSNGYKTNTKSFANSSTKVSDVKSAYKKLYGKN